MNNIVSTIDDVIQSQDFKDFIINNKHEMSKEAIICILKKVFDWLNNRKTYKCCDCFYNMGGECKEYNIVPHNYRFPADVKWRQHYGYVNEQHCQSFQDVHERLGTTSTKFSLTNGNSENMYRQPNNYIINLSILLKKFGFRPLYIMYNIIDNGYDCKIYDCYESMVQCYKTESTENHMMHVCVSFF